MLKLSVIVPVYNGSLFINECIDSIENALTCEYEVIVVDDGSTDNGVSIIEERILKNSRIKLIKKINGGVSSARMLGIDAATGTHILFVDVDDKLVGSLNYDEVGSLENSDWIIFSNAVNDETVELSETAIYKAILNLGSKYQSSHMGAVWSKLYRLDIIKDNTLEFNEQLFHGEDMLFNLKYYSFCKKINYVRKGLYEYRVQIGSATNRFQPKLPTNEADFHSLLKDQLAELDLDFSKEINYMSINGLLICVKKTFAHKDNSKPFSCRLEEFRLFIDKNKYAYEIDKCHMDEFGFLDRVCVLLLKARMYKTLLTVTRIVSQLKSFKPKKTKILLKRI